MAEELIDDPNWDRKTLEKLLFATLKEQKRKRRWGIVFKLLFFTYLFIILAIIWPSSNTLPTPSKGKNHIGLIDIRGVIEENGASNAENVIESLQDAFKDKNTQAVILHINSPGGSPVQASEIYNEVTHLKTKYPKIKVYAVCGDLCASAAYFIASSADQIYANQASLVGSIGVLMDGFGFVDTIKKIGVERRLITSGSHKGFLDPFTPEKPDEVKFAQGLLDDVHQQFIDAVKKGRGARLKETPEIFSGLIWTGQQSLPLGLVDGFGSVNSVARDVIKNKSIVDYTIKPGLFQQLSDRMGASFGKEIGSELGLVPKGFR